MGEIPVSKVFQETAGYSPEELLRYGIDHLASAGLLFRQEPKCYDSAGYLSQLGLELILKSVIIFERGQLPTVDRVAHAPVSLSSLRPQAPPAGF